MFSKHIATLFPHYANLATHAVLQSILLPNIHFRVLYNPLLDIHFNTNTLLSSLLSLQRASNLRHSSIDLCEDDRFPQHLLRFFFLQLCVIVMATTTRQIALCVCVLLVLGMMAQPSEASSFVFYSGGCTGNTATLNACGCSSIPSNVKGSYTFTYQGQTAAAYDSASCTGVAQTRFDSSTGQCTPIGWQSVFIQC